MLYLSKFEYMHCLCGMSPACVREWRLQLQEVIAIAAERLFFLRIKETRHKMSQLSSRSAVYFFFFFNYIFFFANFHKYKLLPSVSCRLCQGKKTQIYPTNKKERLILQLKHLINWSWLHFRLKATPDHFIITMLKTKVNNKKKNTRQISVGCSKFIQIHS